MFGHQLAAIHSKVELPETLIIYFFSNSRFYHYDGHFITKWFKDYWSRLDRKVKNAICRIKIAHFDSPSWFLIQELASIFQSGKGIKELVLSLPLTELPPLSKFKKLEIITAHEAAVKIEAIPEWVKSLSVYSITKTLANQACFLETLSCEFSDIDTSISFPRLTRLETWVGPGHTLMSASVLNNMPLLQYIQGYLEIKTPLDLEALAAWYDKGYNCDQLRVYVSGEDPYSFLDNGPVFERITRVECNAGAILPPKVFLVFPNAIHYPAVEEQNAMPAIEEPMDDDVIIVE
jgi:hypothetical protein